MTKEEIITYAGEIEKYIKEEIVDNFNIGDNGFMSDLQHYVTQLENRSKEYHTPSFVVLVVGPVKSGKSTFVNLIAKNYVSPTHFLECTVRPSIITKMKDNPSLKVYKSCKLKEKSEQTKEILDFLNGLIEEQDIKDVEIGQHELSRESIDKYVKRNLKEVQNDEILLTAIQTEGGKLLQDNVILVDMPGFDGAKVNFNTPAYKDIVERADLIIFVQSSNSAISKVSSEFFELLSNKNGSVPVCLIHNVFEAAYWRSDELKIQNIEAQKVHAVDVIREKYRLTLDDQCAFNLNLGKVNDLRDNNYEDMYKEVLDREAIEFEKVEEEIYKLFAKRERIRLKNCITRTGIQLENLSKKIENLQRRRKDLLEEYNNVKNDFDSPGQITDQMNLTIDISTDIKELKDRILSTYYTKLNQVSKKGWEGNIPFLKDKIFDGCIGGYKRKTAIRIVNEFLYESKKIINDYLNEKINVIPQAIKDNKIFLDIISNINNAFTKIQESKSFTLGLISTKDVKIEIGNKLITYKYDISVEDLVPGVVTTYNSEEIRSFLTSCKKNILGEKYGEKDIDGKKETIIVKGCLENNIFPEIENIISQSIADVISSVKSSLSEIIEERKWSALSSIIPDINHFNSDNDKLENFKKKVEFKIIDLNNE